MDETLVFENVSSLNVHHEDHKPSAHHYSYVRLALPQPEAYELRSVGGLVGGLVNGNVGGPVGRLFSGPVGRLVGPFVGDVGDDVGRMVGGDDVGRLG
jgi:hypothetical protein